MSVIIKKKEKRLVPEGMHLARCVRVIDLGTQESKFGKTKKIILSWELPECKAVFKEENGEEPFVLSNTYNQSLDKKSNLVRDLTPWIGAGFAKKADCDLGSLVLGKACHVNVIHEMNDTGETYAKIIAIAPIPKGMAVPDQILPSLEYSIKDEGNDVFGELPIWIQEKIKASDEVAGVRPSVAEITERNVRQANANASSANDEADELVEVNTEAQLATATAGETEEIEIPY
jgi:hypothetical protein